MHIGDIEVLPVIDGVARLKPRNVYGMKEVQPGRKGYTEADWEPHRYLLDSDAKMEMPLGGFLVLAGDRKILVDAGIADLGFGPFSGGAFLESLHAHGYHETDITDVVLTHLHADHIGWTAQNGELVFTNATYRCDVKDWDHFQVAVPGPGDPTVERLEPLRARLEPWDGAHTLFPGVDTMEAYGHTPGSTVIVLSSGQQRAMMLGDVVHCAVELLDDDWTRIYDVDPDLALRTRVALARELEGSDTVVAGAHFPGLEFGRVLPGQGTRRWVIG
ncbi:MAG: beta-lactamase domain protein [Acidimicrobiia bacterium]|nr:beta-lactamase domain protein [Acidimicrobiia bacterium]